MKHRLRRFGSTSSTKSSCAMRPLSQCSPMPDSVRRRLSRSGGAMSKSARGAVARGRAANEDASNQDGSPPSATRERSQRVETRLRPPEHRRACLPHTRRHAMDRLRLPELAETPVSTRGRGGRTERYTSLRSTPQLRVAALRGAAERCRDRGTTWPLHPGSPEHVPARHRGAARSWKGERGATHSRRSRSCHEEWCCPEVAQEL